MLLPRCLLSYRLRQFNDYSLKLFFILDKLIGFYFTL
nr:MAG TPA_asm: hypothetical protein [Caudoviricetes sp.]DAQ34268.1 MAG TPA: hypothetical protein [Caudoviricetes sp.]